MHDKAEGLRSEQASYLSILRSTVLVGGSSVIVLAASLVRVKIVALLLGPSGMGIMGLYNAVADLAVAAAGLGVQQSGVREIAQAAATKDDKRIAQTAMAVRWISMFLGVAGAVCLAALCVPLSQLTFGTSDNALPMALLGLVVLLRIWAAGETAAVQGRRRIGDLSWLNILAAIVSVFVTIPLVVMWEEGGIVPALILTALATAGFAWWFGRRAVPNVFPTEPFTVRKELEDLLRLGFAFLISALLTMGAAYMVRIIVLHEGGVRAAGLYQAGWAIAGVYVGFVLQAMGTDFYPRLTGLTDDHEQMNRLVNEQTQISLLLAAPGVMATITYAPLAMEILYSAEFIEAANLLRFMCLGMLLRVVAWPMGFIVLAKSWRGTFIATEISATVIHVGLATLLVRWIGPNGAGLAFFGLYACHSVLIYSIVRYRCGFAFTATSVRLMAILLPMSGVAAGAFLFLPFWPATTVASGITVTSTLVCLLKLGQLTAAASLSGVLASITSMLRRRSAKRSSGSPQA